MRQISTNVPEWVSRVVGRPVQWVVTFLSGPHVTPESVVDRTAIESQFPHLANMCTVPPSTTSHGSLCATPAPMLFMIRLVIHVNPPSLDQPIHAVSMVSPTLRP